MTAGSDVNGSPLGIRTSAELDQLAPALAAAQASIKHAAEDSTNPHFRSRYSSLTACWDACRQPLSGQGLAVVQGLAFDGAAVVCTSRLLHKSGQWIEAALSLPISAKISPQSIGSASTYAKRFGLCALVGITSGEMEDDDGTAGTVDTAQAADTAQAVDTSQQAADTAQAADNRPADPQTWAPRNRRSFMATINERGWQYPELCGFLAWMNRPRPSAMDSDQRRNLLIWLKGKTGQAMVADWRATLNIEGGDQAEGVSP